MSGNFYFPANRNVCNFFMNTTAKTTTTTAGARTTAIAIAWHDLTVICIQFGYAVVSKNSSYNYWIEI